MADSDGGTRSGGARTGGTRTGYFGIDPAGLVPDDCRYALLGLPYDGTASYVKGAARGPAAILHASQQIEDFDEELDFCPCEAGIATLQGPPLEGSDPGRMVEIVETSVLDALQPDRHLIIVGGEHSVTAPAIRATAKALGEFDVLQIDAHCDLRQTYQGTPLSHASVMARVRDQGIRITQVGVRSRSPEESAALADPEVRTFWMHEIRAKAARDWIPEVLATLGPRVYVTLDFDALDPAIMPSTGTPEPGGLDWPTTLALLKAVALGREVVGSDFMELSPIEGFHAPDFLAARLIYRWIGYLEVARRG